MLIKTIYHLLKRNRATSALLQSIDVVRPVKLTGLGFSIFRRVVSNHWVRSDYEEIARRSFRYIVNEIGANTLFDIGANVGIYAIEFLSIVPKGRVVAVEPNGRVFQCLEQTCLGTHLSAVALQFAVSDVPGEIEIKYDPMAPAMGGIVPGEDGLFNSERIYGAFLVSQKVTAITVDQLVAQYFSPDFVKIDVEGAEFLVFKGGAQLFSEAHPALFFEFSQDKARIHELIRHWGYAIFSESLEEISYPEFATFALHEKRHAAIIERLRTKAHS